MTNRVFLAATLLLGAGSACGADGQREATSGVARAPFRVSLQGEALLIEDTEPVAQPTCSDELEVLRWSEASGWQPLRDDRPSLVSHGGYFIDDRFVPARCGLSLACDTGPRCRGFTAVSLDAREYIAAAAPRPAPAGDPTDDCVQLLGFVRDSEVPNITSQAAQAPLAARIRYFPDGCGTGELREVIVAAQ